MKPRRLVTLHHPALQQEYLPVPSHRHLRTPVAQGIRQRWIPSSDPEIATSTPKVATSRATVDARKLSPRMGHFDQIHSSRLPLPGDTNWSGNVAIVQ